MNTKIPFLNDTEFETLYTFDPEQDTEHNRRELHIVRLTPKQASAWLSLNTHNRSTSADQIRQLAASVVDGTWKHTHQGICFASMPDGSLLLVDGQHRLLACARANREIAIEVSLFENVTLRDDIDRVFRRKPGFISGLGDRRHPISRVLLDLELGRIGYNRSLTTQSVTECFERNHSAIVAIEDVTDNTVPGKSKHLRHPVLSALCFAYPIAPASVLSFARQVQTGEMLSLGDPALTLRGWFKKGLSEEELVFATLASTKAHIEGRKLAKQYTGHSPYDWICQRRRAMRIPNTPAYRDQAAE